MRYGEEEGWFACSENLQATSIPAPKAGAAEPLGSRNFSALWGGISPCSTGKLGLSLLALESFWGITPAS